jgi:hypothetical protein
LEATGEILIDLRRVSANKIPQTQILNTDILHNRVLVILNFRHPPYTYTIEARILVLGHRGLLIGNLGNIREPFQAQIQADTSFGIIVIITTVALQIYIFKPSAKANGHEPEA